MSTAAFSLPTALVTSLAVMQTGILTTLLVPWPIRIRKPLIRIILENPIIAKLVYGTKIACLFIALMWIDSASSLYKMFYARRKPVPGDNEVAMERSAKWLVAQRQIAVCSVALFLSFVLYATVALHVRVLTLEEQIAKMEGKDIGKPIEKSAEEYKDLQDHQGPDAALRAFENVTKLDEKPSAKVSDKDASEIRQRTGK